MTTLSISEKISGEAYCDYFYADGTKVLSSPKWAMSVKAAGSMRFRYNEENENRPRFFSRFFGSQREIAPVELIHSKTVYAIEHASDIAGRTGDGIITNNPRLVPAVTVADCMPIFLYEPKTRVFGCVHSGWRGTGIAAEAIRLAGESYGAQAHDFLVVLGPHIQRCCYSVDKERADYFRRTFSEDCVSALDENAGTYRLSLAKANLALLKKAGVKDENIALCTDCTCCQKDAAGNFPFGSFRRETSATVGKPFTVQAAFCYFDGAENEQGEK